MYCPKCGTKNPEGAVFCENCGNRLTADDIQTVSVDKNNEKQKHSNVLVILGYILAILSGIIGAIIGLYLYTRDNSYYKVHGRNILIISVIVIIIGIGVTAFAFQSLSNQLSPTSTTNESSGSDVTQVQREEQTTTSTSTDYITSSQAKTIAQNFAQSYAPGAKAGTPSLSGSTYTVPIYGNGALVGEVLVNSKTGKVVDHWFQDLPQTEEDVT